MDVIKSALSVFDRQQKIRLLPFVVTSVFFVIQPYEADSFLGTIFKMLPNFSLIVYVIITRSQFPRKTKTINLETLTPEDQYSCCILAGLCAFFITDILVTIPYIMVLGGLTYTMMYLCYYFAVEIDGRHQGCKSRFSWLFGLLYVNTFLCLQAFTDSYGIKLFFIIFLIPLFLVGWKATSAVEENSGDTAVLMGCIGASMFILTDILCISQHMGLPVPFAEFLHTLTFFSAQCGWALSTSNFN